MPSKSLPFSAQQTLTMQQMLNLGLKHHMAGRLSQAEDCYQQVLRANPRQPVALHYLGVIAHQGGKNGLAAKLIRQALAISPKDAEAHGNLSRVLQQLGKLEEAERSLRKSLELKPDNADAYFNLGNIQKDAGNLEEAYVSYQKALSYNPNDPDALNSLGITLSTMGRFGEAYSLLLSALEKNPQNFALSTTLIELLNDFTPPPEESCLFTEMQSGLKKINIDLGSTTSIDDDFLRSIYHSADAILGNQELPLSTDLSQVWRGLTNKSDCLRYMRIFDIHNAIPEYCFGCYKVQVDVATMMDLFRLFIAFNNIQLPGDCTRKCLIEVRPNASGFYKGIVYCNNAETVDEILSIVQVMVQASISPNASVSLKRGCSEFAVPYPDYPKVSRDRKGMMDYPVEWRRFESEVDAHPPRSASPTHNHDGLTLRDALVLRTWISYAATIGDKSYLGLTEKPVPHLPLIDRPVYS